MAISLWTGMAAPVDRQSRWASLFALAIAALALLPVATLIVLSLGDTSQVWRHLYANVLPRSLATTLGLVFGVGVSTAAIGVTTAWLVSRYRFFGRDTLAALLMLPLAIPTYVAAYCAVELFGFTGPVQEMVRSIGGYQSPGQYWFPDLRSTPGAVFVLSAVLYPYVYLPCRLVYSRQAGAVIESARLLGAGSVGVFRRIAVPLAWPAATAGVTLAILETLNDIGAVEILGVRSLSFTIYDTWLNRASLPGAAQIACVTLILVALLVAAERWLRGNRRFDVHGTVALAELRLAGLTNFGAFLACALPVAAGLGIPAFVLAKATLRRLDQIGDPQLAAAALNSVALAGMTGLIAVACAFEISRTGRRSRLRQAAERIATLGYALPGPVLAIGTLYLFTSFDNGLDRWARALTGWSTGLLISGTGLIVVYACSVRFLSVAYGPVVAGRGRIGEHVLWAARTLGRSPWQATVSVELPLLAPTMSIAALMVFVETLKELPATLILRPFGYSTLATFVYEKASQGHFEDGAFAALAIVAIGAAALAALGGLQPRGAVVDQRKSGSATRL